MIRAFMTVAASAVVLTLSPAVFAQQPDHGTAAQAKAMLLKAEAAMKADKTKALEMFNNGEGGFLDRDLYVFCSQASDGKIVAHGNPNAKQLLGQDQRTSRMQRKGFRQGALRRRRKTRRSDHQGQLRVCEAGWRFKAGTEGEPGDPGQRSGLRRWLLQVDRSRADDCTGRRSSAPRALMATGSRSLRLGRLLRRALHPSHPPGVPEHFAMHPCRPLTTHPCVRRCIRGCDLHPAAHPRIISRHQPGMPGARWAQPAPAASPPAPALRLKCPYSPMESASSS